MDYKEKYEQALEYMRTVYPTLNGAAKEDVEHHFPELKESKDEKIRKELLRAFTVTANKREREIYGNGITYGQVLAWLEKQGLQKQRKEWNADDVWNHNQIMDILQEYNRTELMDWLEKQFEQNPIEWSEEDEKMCEKLLFLMEEENSISSWEGCYEWLNSLMRRMKGK